MARYTFKVLFKKINSKLKNDNFQSRSLLKLFFSMKLTINNCYIWLFFIIFHNKIISLVLNERKWLFEIIFKWAILQGHSWETLKIHEEEPKMLPLQAETSMITTTQILLQNQTTQVDNSSPVSLRPNSKRFRSTVKKKKFPSKSLKSKISKLSRPEAARKPS